MDTERANDTGDAAARAVYDALEKVTGRARYTADLTRAAMLHAAFVRAPSRAAR